MNEPSRYTVTQASMLAMVLAAVVAIFFRLVSCVENTRSEDPLCDLRHVGVVVHMSGWRICKCEEGKPCGWQEAPR